MTDNEMPPQCRAQLTLDDSEPYRCTLGENHAAMHRDQDGDTWNITYVDAPAAPLGERVDHLLLGNLGRRITGLEARMNPVCGHRDPSSGLVCQRPPDHYGEVHSTATDRLDGTVWNTGHSSAEHRAGSKAEPTVLAAQLDGRQVMSDGSVRDPAEPGAVLIDPVELGKLLEASERLTALEAAGVDNWDGYEDALNGVTY